MLRIGILGGTFDPPHFGHLRIAEEAYQEFGLHAVWFCPAYAPPHRTEKPYARYDERFAMTQLATIGNSAFSAVEFERGKSPSYTINTLKTIKGYLKDVELYFILGWDSFMEIETWYSYQELPKYANFIVCTRGKMDPQTTENIFKQRVNSLFGDPAIDTFHLLFVYPLDISSREIRRLLWEGKSIRYLVPDAVNHYIKSLKLYCS